MKEPIGTFDLSRLQALRAGQEVNIANAIVTHTGNPLQEIHLKTNDAALTLSLVKGGTIVSTTLLGEELFDRDGDYQDVAKITRTKGNPNIFPVFNQMPAGVKFETAQDVLPNHGIARNGTWKAYIVSDLPKTVIIQLKSDEKTREYYPYDFTYTQYITLEQNSLIIDQHIETAGEFSVGFHPYFRIGNKRDIEISGIEQGTSYWYLPNALSKDEKDEVIAHNRSLVYVPGKEGSLNFAAGEVNHHFDLEHHDNTTVTVTDPGLNRRLLIDKSDAYKGITVWCNEEEERSACVEPVTDRSGQVSAKPSPWTGRVCFTVERL